MKYQPFVLFPYSAVVVGVLTCFFIFAGITADFAEPHLIRDGIIRAKVEAQFTEQYKLALNRENQLFSVFHQELTQEEREALKFLFAFMPLSDLADYDGEYFLRVAQVALEARRTMPWGNLVPEALFFRYVLPCRVNTENLDYARPVIFAELKDRVKKMSMLEAVQEVNHWCHERVTYHGSDMRTSGPLATLRTSWGRCGEESTLVVSALRALSIPARQVYSPRWAHMDNNHAWVEAWVDGKWRYFGACEPEPAMDMGWFREPARRAMMIHTKVLGGSPGTEDKIHSTSWFDEINVLSAYAPVQNRLVRVVDGSGKPVEGADVEFGIFNSAEFYPLARKKTGTDGSTKLVLGKGDIRIWATKGSLVGYKKFSRNEKETVIVLGPLNTSERVESTDFFPPEQPTPSPVSVNPEVAENNKKRLAEENRKRDAYMSTFMSEAKSVELATELGLDPKIFWPLIRKSLGNWREIAKFFRRTRDEHRCWALKLVETLSDKDLRDIPADVLKDHLDCCLTEMENPPYPDLDLFVSGILAPRIAHELIRPWRGYLRREFGSAFLGKVRENPETAVAWIKTNIRLNGDANYYNVPISPRGVYELKTADGLSRDIFLVALCRTAGVPARLEPLASLPQFMAKGSWRTVDWDGKPSKSVPSAKLSLTIKSETPPGYFSDFTLARFQDGRYETLGFENASWTFFQKPFGLPCGHYALTTGYRQADGSVLVNQHFFELKEGQNRSILVEICNPKKGLLVLGRLDMNENLKMLTDGRSFNLAQSAKNIGAILAWIGQDDEPTNHALRDLERLKEPFEKWGGGLILILGQAPEVGLKKNVDSETLAQQTIIALDDREILLAKALNVLKKPVSVRLPVFVGLNPKGEVIYFSEGYNIGVGDRILEAVMSVEHSAGR